MNFAASLSNHNVPSTCHSRANGNPGRRRERVPRSARDWIPAFAGMTVTEVSAYACNVARFTGSNPYFVTDPKFTSFQIPLPRSEHSHVWGLKLPILSTYRILDSLLKFSRKRFKLSELFLNHFQPVNMLFYDLFLVSHGHLPYG
jgi:hypothetical protein